MTCGSLRTSTPAVRSRLDRGLEVVDPQVVQGARRAGVEEQSHAAEVEEDESRRVVRRERAPRRGGRGRRRWPGRGRRRAGRSGRVPSTDGSPARHNGSMTDHRPVETWLTDMDGVLVHEEDAIPGAAEFITALEQSGRSLPRPDEQLDLHAARPAGPPAAKRDRRAGEGDLDVRARDGAVPRRAATRGIRLCRRRGGADDGHARRRLRHDRPRPRLRGPRRDPHLLVRGDHPRGPPDRAGARFIATNPDPSGPSPAGTLPATGSVAALIRRRPAGSPTTSASPTRS